MATTLSNFKASIPQKRMATGTSKVSTGNINETFKTIDALLKNEMDDLLMPFQFTQPDFYNEYLSARSIVDTGRRPTKLRWNSSFSVGVRLKVALPLTDTGSLTQTL
jgi:hypothetical protein